jgi:hypothetical protein
MRRFNTVYRSGICSPLRGVVAENRSRRYALCAVFLRHIFCALKPLRGFFIGAKSGVCNRTAIRICWEYWGQGLDNKKYMK